jgi:DNA-binding NtrC family response regulator
MRVLCFNSRLNREETAELLMQRGYEVVSVAEPHAALELICTGPFDAVVISEEREDSEVLDFTAKAHGARPGLPVFLLSDWGLSL